MVNFLNMKRFLIIAFAVASLSVPSVMAQEPVPEQKASALKPKLVLKQPGVKTDAEMAEFVKEYTDEKTGKSYQLEVSFSAKKPATPLTSTQKKALLKPTAKLPYQVFAALYELKQSGKKKTASRIDKGTFEFYVEDDAGHLVLKKKSADFLSLCRS